MRSSTRVGIPHLWLTCFLYLTKQELVADSHMDLTSLGYLSLALATAYKIGRPRFYTNRPRRPPFHSGSGKEVTQETAKAHALPALEPDRASSSNPDPSPQRHFWTNPAQCMEAFLLCMAGFPKFYVLYLKWIPMIYPTLWMWPAGFMPKVWTPNLRIFFTQLFRGKESSCYR